MSKILYNVNGQNTQNLPSTGTFGTMINSASSASTIEEAKKKVLFNQKTMKIPQGKFEIYKKLDINKRPYWLAEIFTRGGKTKKQRKYKKKMKKNQKSYLKKSMKKKQLKLHLIL